ncbi:hypothetical protein OSTOST_00637 [Ostertagia ostertagi]
MFGIPVLLALLCASWAHYGVPARQPVGGYGAAPLPPFYQPIYAKPVVLPELPAQYQILWPFPRRDRPWRESSSSGTSIEEDAKKPLWIAVTRKSSLLMTSDYRILSYGVAIEKIIRCGRGGRWISPDIYGDATSFGSLRCMKMSQMRNVTTA